MAHIIHSHYDPVDRERLEHETGQRINDQSDPWQTESSFSAQRRIRTAPTFVPATVSYDEWGVPSHTSSPTPADHTSSSLSSAEWYRSLITASISHELSPPRPSSASSSSCQDAGPSNSKKPHRERTTKNNWFISEALRSEPSTKPSSPAPSLADLLARDPPPLPSRGHFKPPVWLHLGPSNRGFGMLQRSGWNEGEGLGAHVIRSVARARDIDTPPSSSLRVEKDIQTTQEVTDSSLSDSEASEEALEHSDVTAGLMQTQVTEEAFASHTQRSLLTPLPTILKADRLGIGLKAKTEGPYKQSKKRVTHSAIALAAHIRSAEEMRRKKAEVGKGRRGFSKVHKRDEDARISMLAYLNE